MKILFHIAHPAQYHMFKYTIRNLVEKGHKIKITINTKDILEQLLIADNVEYENILPKRRKRNTQFSTFLTLLKKDFQIFKTQLKGNYDMMVGTEAALSHIGWLFHKPVLIMDEDDVSVVPIGAKITLPFAKHVVAPVSCDLGKWTNKKIAYKGFQKIAYLHPAYFIPNKEIVDNYLKSKEIFFLIRVSDLTAYHDLGVKGFNEVIIRKIINVLLPFGKVLLSTERKLPEDLNQYLFKTDISKIHHFLYYANFLIADSQSMCVEAAVLGTPSIRFSDFVGKIGVLEELEHLYGLTFGVHPSKEDILFERIELLLSINNIKIVWNEKRSKMLNDKIDVTSFWTWLIDTYPNSIQQLKENPGFQDSF